MNNPAVFEENFHMTVDQFNNLYELLEEHLMPLRPTRPKDSISPKQKLAAVIE